MPDKRYWISDDMKYLKPTNRKFESLKDVVRHDRNNSNSKTKVIIWNSFFEDYKDRTKFVPIRDGKHV